MDEPFGALDEFTRQHLDIELASLWSKRKLTIVFVTHSIHEAVFLSTRVVVMGPRPGRLIDEVAIDEPHPRGDAFRAVDPLRRRTRSGCRPRSRAPAAARPGDDARARRRRSRALSARRRPGFGLDRAAPLIVALIVIGAWQAADRGLATCPPGSCPRRSRSGAR